MNLAAYNPYIGQHIKNNAGSSADHGFIAHYLLPAAAAIVAAADNVKAAVVLADGVTTTLTIVDITLQPPTPRVLSITGNAVTVVGNVVITGTDAAGNVLVDTIVANGAATVIGVKAFASITRVVLPARGAAADSISLGLSDRFGLPFLLPHDTVLKILNGGTATTVAAGSSFSATVLADNFIDPTAAINAVDIDVYLVV